MEAETRPRKARGTAHTSCRRLPPCSLKAYLTPAFQFDPFVHRLSSSNSHAVSASPERGFSLTLGVGKSVEHKSDHFKHVYVKGQSHQQVGARPCATFSGVPHLQSSP